MLSKQNVVKQHSAAMQFNFEILPEDIKNARTGDCIKSKLKTKLFSDALCLIISNLSPL